jgi:hypothetical protein
MDRPRRVLTRRQIDHSAAGRRAGIDGILDRRPGAVGLLAAGTVISDIESRFPLSNGLGSNLGRNRNQNDKQDGNPGTVPFNRSQDHSFHPPDSFFSE